MICARRGVKNGSPLTKSPPILVSTAVAKAVSKSLSVLAASPISSRPRLRATSVKRLSSTEDTTPAVDLVLCNAANFADLGQQLVQPLQALLTHLDRVGGHARAIAARLSEARRESKLDRIKGGVEEYRNGLGRRLGVQRRRQAPARNDQLHVTLNEVRQQLGQLVDVTACPTILDQDVATLDEA